MGNPHSPKIIAAQRRQCEKLGLTIQAQLVILGDGSFYLFFHLLGDLDHLRIPLLEQGQRMDGLWQHTCFELFLRKGSRYREFNFSPSGDWQIYDFVRYRERAEKEAKTPAPTISVDCHYDGLTIKVYLPKALIPWTEKLTLGLCAVLKHQDDSLSYWALQHVPDGPDFHCPEVCCVTINPLVPTLLVPVTLQIA